MIYKKNLNPIEEKINSNLDLIYSIFKTQDDLFNETTNYEFADGDLIDYYSYSIKATKAKLDYLVKKAKHRGIIINRIKQIELKSEHEIQMNQ